MLQRTALYILVSFVVGCGAMQAPTPNQPEPEASRLVAVSIVKITQVEVGFIAFSPTDEDLDLELIAQNRSFPFTRALSNDPKLHVHGLGISAFVYGEQSTIEWEIFVVKNSIRTQVTQPIHVIAYKNRVATSQALVAPLADGVFIIDVSAEGLVTTIQAERPSRPPKTPAAKTPAPEVPNAPAATPTPPSAERPLEEFQPVPPITQPLKCTRGECVVG